MRGNTLTNSCLLFTKRFSNELIYFRHESVNLYSTQLPCDLIEGINPSFSPSCELFLVRGAEYEARKTSPYLGQLTEWPNGNTSCTRPVAGVPAISPSILRNLVQFDHTPYLTQNCAVLFEIVLPRKPNAVHHLLKQRRLHYNKNAANTNRLHFSRSTYTAYYYASYLFFWYENMTDVPEELSPCCLWQQLSITSRLRIYFEPMYPRRAIDTNHNQENIWAEKAWQLAPLGAVFLWQHFHPPLGPTPAG